MGSVFLFFIIFHIFLASLIFWLLTYVGFITRDVYENYDSGIFYECGFRSLQKINIKFNLNTIVLSIFMVLYEIEFLLLVPYSFSIDFISHSESFVVLYFVISIAFTLLIDIFSNSIKWEY